MAIDSALKRKSISGIGGGIPGVTPNAAKPQAWRQASGWSYVGILAGGGPAVVEESKRGTFWRRSSSVP